MSRHPRYRAFGLTIDSGIALPAPLELDPLRATDVTMRIGPLLEPPGAGSDIAVVSPCGACRELIHDYDAKARVIVPNGKQGPEVTTIAELLPNKYRRGVM